MVTSSPPSDWHQSKRDLLELALLIALIILVCIAIATWIPWDKAPGLSPENWVILAILIVVLSLDLYLLVVHLPWVGGLAKHFEMDWDMDNKRIIERVESALGRVFLTRGLKMEYYESSFDQSYYNAPRTPPSLYIKLLEGDSRRIVAKIEFSSELGRTRVKVRRNREDLITSIEGAMVGLSRD